MPDRMLRRYMVFDGLSPTFKHIPAVKAEAASSAASCLLNIKEDRYGGVEVSHPRALLLAASCCCRCCYCTAAAAAAGRFHHFKSHGCCFTLLSTRLAVQLGVWLDGADMDADVMIDSFNKSWLCSYFLNCTQS